MTRVEQPRAIKRRIAVCLERARHDITVRAQSRSEIWRGRSCRSSHAIRTSRRRCEVKRNPCLRTIQMIRKFLPGKAGAGG